MKNSALGFIEARGFTGIIEATDKMPKTSDVQFSTYQNIGGGFNTVIYAGEVGAVKAALENSCISVESVGMLHAQNIIPRPHKDIYEFVKNVKEKKINIYKHNSLGMVETKGFVPMVEAADTGLKSADVLAVNWLTIGGGYTTVFFRGDVAAVSAAVESAAAKASLIGEVSATHVIPRPHIDANIVLPIGKIDNINNSQKNKIKGEALGVIETQSFVSLVEAVDAGLKSASVTCAGWFKVGSALVSTIFRGDVSAVKAAVQAAESSSSKISKVISTHIIARPNNYVEEIV